MNFVNLIIMKQVKQHLTKKKYQTPKLKKIGAVKNLTQKTGSVADVITTYTA